MTVEDVKYGVSVLELMMATDGKTYCWVETMGLTWTQKTQTFHSWRERFSDDVRDYLVWSQPKESLRDSLTLMLTKVADLPIAYGYTTAATKWIRLQGEKPSIEMLALGQPYTLTTRRRQPHYCPCTPKELDRLKDAYPDVPVHLAPEDRNMPLYTQWTAPLDALLAEIEKRKKADAAKGVDA